MLDIVLDTNVLVGALLKPDGSNSQALRAIISKPESFNICFSSIMLAEYEDVLSRPLITGRGLQREAEQLLSLLRDISEEIVPKPLYALVYPDRGDRPFLEASVYVNGLLLTNNLRDFPFADVTVLGPDEFLTWLAQQE
jgi:putative PIN family toxin of toxin-antitoxin system